MKNLLLNAWYHGIPPEPDTKPMIRLGMYRRPMNTLCIIVEDNGPGIPRSRQSDVTQPFTRLKRSVDQQIPGSGLGLHIVRRSAELHGGRLIIESPYHTTNGELERGCRFTVELTLKERPDA